MKANFDVYVQNSDPSNRQFVGRFSARNAVHAVQVARQIVHVGDVAIPSNKPDHDIRQA